MSFQNSKKVSAPGRKRLSLRQVTSTRLLMRQRLNLIVKCSVACVILFAVGFGYLNFGVSENSKASGLSYTWNGTISNNWNNASNWTPNGIPSTGDNITLNSGALNYPQISSVNSIANLTTATGSILDLNGNTLTVTGTASLSGGTFNNTGSSASIILNGTSSVFGSSGSPVFNIEVNVNSATIGLRNATFNNALTILKTGTTNDACYGNNNFNGLTSISNSGTGYLILANTTRDLFNNAVTFNSTGTGVIYPAYNGTGNQFNDNITVNCSSTGGVQIGANIGTSVLAATKTVNIGSTGFASGTLLLKNFTTSTPQNITLTGSGVLRFGPNSTFNDITASAGGIGMDGGTYNGTVTLTKTGAVNDQGAGNNTFNGAVTITNSGSGYMIMSNGTRDIFNQSVKFNANGAGIIYPSYNGTGTQFNENITVSSTSTGGVYIGANNGLSNLATGKIIDIGASGFSSGGLMLKNFTTATAQNITLTGNAVLNVGGGTSSFSDITAVAGGICLNGGTFNGIASFTKTGSTNDQGVGNNTFNSSLSITSNGTGYMLLSNNTRDIYNTDVTFTSTNTGVIYPSYNGTGTQFNENIIVNSTSTGGVYIGANIGLSTLATGKTVNIGSSGFSSGGLMLKNFTTATAQNITLTGNAVLSVGGGTSSFADITAVAGGICLNGGTFNGNASFTKTGTTNDQGIGNNTFNSGISITSSGSGYMILANNTRDIFNTAVTFTSSGAGVIYAAYNGTGNQFNDNITVNSTSTGGVCIGGNTGTSALAINKTVVTNSTAFPSGTLTLRNFTANTAQNISLGTSATLNFGASSVFTDITAVAGGIYLNGTTFNGTTSITKTGASGDGGTGNNTFNGATTITNSGSGYLLSANTTRDIFNIPLNLFNTGTGQIYLAHNGIGTQFNDNIIVNSTAGNGIQIGAGTGTSSLGTGKTIIIGSSGFSSGSLTIKGLVTTTTQNLTLTGTASLVFGIGSSFSDVVVTAPGIVLNGSTFNGLTHLSKTGASGDYGNGNNTFNGTTIISNSGSGYLLSGNTTRDIFNTPLNLSNSGTGQIYLAHNSAGTQFNDSLIVSSTSGSGIQIGAGIGTSTLASSKLIVIGAAGFSAGTLTLKGFTTATPQNFTLTGTGTFSSGTNSSFSDLTVVAGGIALNGGTFNGVTNLSKTGPGSESATGGNTFNNIVNINNSGSGYLLSGNTIKDIFNAPVTLTNTGSGIIYLAHNSLATQFNENVIINSTGAGSIRFGQGSGTSELAANKTISIGSTGFTSGEFYLRNFLQTGTAAQTINLAAGTGTIYFQSGTVFNGPLNYKFPQVLLNGSTFNNTASIEKSGAGNNASSGSNVFNSDVTIKNSGTGIFYLENATADTYTSNASFIQTGTGALYPAYNTNNYFPKDISTTGSTSTVNFGQNNGIVTLNGTAAQNINGSLATPVTISRLVLSNVNGVTLNVPVTVNNVLTLSNGRINSSAINLLTIGNGILSVTGVSDSNFVNGPVRKTGNKAFEFPVGKDIYYRPVSMAAPVSSTDQFTAEYIISNPGSLYSPTSLDPGLHHISKSEYWTFNRNNGTASPKITLSWNVLVSGAINTLTDLRVARWDVPTSKWKDLGNGATTGTTGNGTIITTGTVSSFGTFTLGSSSANNALPIKLIEFKAALQNDAINLTWKTATEKNNDFFTIEKSVDNVKYEIVGKVPGAGTSHSILSYELTDLQPYQGTSYYKLKQTDYDGKFVYSNPIVVKTSKEASQEFTVYSTSPNPFSNKLKIEFFNPATATLTFQLLGLNGNIVFTDNFEAQQGKTSFEEENLDEIKQGVYILNLLADDKIISTVKVVKR